MNRRENDQEWIPEFVNHKDHKGHKAQVFFVIFVGFVVRYGVGGLPST